MSVSGLQFGHSNLGILIESYAYSFGNFFLIELKVIVIQTKFKFI